jgi:hypothetical protein
MQPIESRVVLGKHSRMSLTEALYINGITSTSFDLAGGNQEGCSTALAVAKAIKKEPSGQVMMGALITCPKSTRL